MCGLSRQSYWLYVPNIKAVHKYRFDARHLNNCHPRAIPLNVHNLLTLAPFLCSAVKTPFVNDWPLHLHHCACSLWGRICKFITGNSLCQWHTTVYSPVLSCKEWGRIAFLWNILLLTTNNTHNDTQPSFVNIQ